MNKKLLELLNAINEKKLAIQNLVEAGKLEEAKTEKAELKKMQDKFDLLKDLDDKGLRLRKMPCMSLPMPQGEGSGCLMI